MKFFKKTYQKVLSWANHRHAPFYLAGVSMADASFFPIPPDVMLVPMVINQPLKAWYYAAITTFFSLIGSLIGYAIGFYAFEWLALPFVQTLGYEAAYYAVVSWFNQYGFLALILAGFTPIPFKVFTIAAGASQMIFVPFFLAAMLGRSLRYFLVAAFVKRFGSRIDILAYAAVFIVVCIMTFYLTGCAVFSSDEPAPVISLKNKAEIREVRTHHLVKTGDTVFLIAWLYDMDYQDLANYNHLKAPYAIHAGLKLRLIPEKTKHPIVIKKQEIKQPKQTHQWHWPAKGKISTVEKGIDISGQDGSDILATQAGKVVYTGEGIRGYGKLVIIKHSDPYLSAYAHNSQVLVKEGDLIKQGQVIAKMGNKLHFEIREHGHPINPLKMLPE